MSYDFLLVERRDSIATVTVNRPEALNAMNVGVGRELAAVAQDLAEDDTLDAVIITGAGRAFVAGADIKAMLEFDADEAADFAALGHRAMNSIAQIPVPVIAAINGFALGGGLELALACDLRYGSTKAKLGLPEVGLSVIPGWGGTQRLGRVVGWHKAREMIYTGKQLSAEEAKAAGLLLDVFEPEVLMTKVNEVADQIAKNGPLAVRAAKESIEFGSGARLGKGLAFEQEVFGDLFGTEDQVEGMTAFVERRAAKFTRK